MQKYTFSLFLILLLTTLKLSAKSDFFRCMWRDDPATTMVIGWHQESGTNPILYYDIDGTSPSNSYAYSKQPDKVVFAKKMNNHFVRLIGLQPNTTYRFVIKDSEGLSRQLKFTTMPNTSTERLSIIAGGDSRNHRTARSNANKLVGKLHPHFVLFAGDMTGGDSGREWIEWFEDWQYTITGNGRLTPIVVARGNHESENKSLVDLFDVPNEKIQYALSFGDNLLRTYTLNSMMPSGGSQKEWLQRDLQNHPHIIWKMAMYHHSIRPHTEKKTEQYEMQINWATLFYKYKVNLVVESDAHVVKTTYPLRPSKESGSEAGFIRDDVNGTVYIGEGCWGAPLRDNNDNKNWTRASGSFNQFKWIWVDNFGIEVRTVKTDNADAVAALPYDKVFSLPKGIQIWQPSSGDVLHIYRKNAVLKHPVAHQNHNSTANNVSTNNATTEVQKIMMDSFSKEVLINYTLPADGDVIIKLINQQKEEIARLEYANQAATSYNKKLNLDKIPKGNYFLQIACGPTLIKQYELIKQ